MKIKVPCSECTKLGRKKDDLKQVPYVPTYPYWENEEIELDKWVPYFEFYCKENHFNNIQIKIELYEILFQQAVYCIIDGYYREAIGTFNTAIEGFIEFAIEILFYFDQNEFVDFKNVWKNISNHSERQLGCYYIMWAKHFGENPITLDNVKIKYQGKTKSYTSVRNSIVHKGGMASREEAIAFGKETYDYLLKHQELVNKELEKINYEPLILREKRLYEKVDIKYTKISGEGEDEMFQSPQNIFIPTFLNKSEPLEFEKLLIKEHQTDYGLIK